MSFIAPLTLFLRLLLRREYDHSGQAVATRHRAVSGALSERSSRCPRKTAFRVLTATRKTSKLAPVKTTFDLPDELIQEVKLRAVTQRRTVKDLMTEILRQALGIPSSAPAPKAAGGMVQTGESGIPVIRCHPRAPARKMSVNALLKLERESQTQEDLRRAGIPL